MTEERSSVITEGSLADYGAAAVEANSLLIGIHLLRSCFQPSSCVTVSWTFQGTEKRIV